MDCIVHGLAKSWTRLSNFHFNQKSPSFCQKSSFSQHSSEKSLCPVSLRNILSVRISFLLSGLSPRKELSVKKLHFVSLRNVLLSVRSPLLSVRFLPSKNTFFLSEIFFFMSVFPQKHHSFCQKFFLSSFSPRKDCISVRNPLICVRFPSELSFFSCQKLPSFCPYLSPRKYRLSF